MMKSYIKRITFIFVIPICSLFFTIVWYTQIYTGNDFKKLENHIKYCKRENCEWLDWDFTGGRFIKRIPPEIGDLDHLYGISFDAVQINKFTTLKNVPNLRALYLQNMQEPVDYGSLSVLESLEKLQIYANHKTKINNIEFLLPMKKLQDLTLANVGIINIEVLLKLPSLETLRVLNRDVFTTNELESLNDKGINVVYISGE